MNARYLLDTNILSDLLRNPKGRAAARIAAVESGAIFTSIIVAAELRFGAAKTSSQQLSGRIARLLDLLEVSSFEPPADRIYSELRASLERAGQPIGGNDLLIAAHALTLGATLVTANVREFSKVPMLAIEDWTR